MQVKKKRNIIFANVFLLLVLVAGATYAWFAINTTANVTVSEVEVKGPGELEMKLRDQTKWTTNLTLTETDFVDLKMVDVSGKGNGTFYRPNAVDGNGNPGSTATWLNVSADQDPNGKATTDHKGANVDYMQINLDFRAKSDNNPTSIKLMLKAGSKISTVAPTAKLKGPDIENKSTFGDFSKDYVVGGIRVSAMPNSTTITGEPIFVWIPEPNVQLKVDKTGETKTYSINTESVTGQDTHTYVSRINNTAEPKYTTATLTGENSAISGQITSGVGSTEKTIVNLTKNGEYYTGSATFYVWLEGCDTEARRALVGGKFRLQLLLDTEEVNQTP